MPPIPFLHKRRDDEERDPGVPTSGPSGRSLRQRLAGMSFEEGQAQLSPRGPNVVGGKTEEQAEADQGAVESVTHENFGTDWVSDGHQFYKQENKKDVDQRSYSWRTGMLADELIKNRRPTGGEASGAPSMSARKIDADMGKRAEKISGGESGGISDGVLTIEQSVVEPFYEDNPNVGDVLQGNLGDCYLLATLVGMANTGEGRARLLEIVRERGSGYTVDFVGLKKTQSEEVDVDDESRVRVGVSPFRGNEGVHLRSQGPESVQLSSEEKEAAIAKYGGRPSSRGGGVWGATRRFFKGFGNRKPPVHTVQLNRSTKVLWPWIVEKAYAAVGGGYDRIGSGGYSNVPMLALMGRDSDSVQSQTWKYTGGKKWDAQHLPPEQISLIFKSARARIQAGGVVTISTRSQDKLGKAGVMDDMWRVVKATRYGITVAVDKERFYSWEGLGKVLNPFIQVETADGSLRAVDPNQISADDKAAVMEAVQAGRTVEVSSKHYLREGDLRLVPNHAYAVLSATARGLEAHNPWGAFQPGRLIRPDEYPLYFGYMQMSEQIGKPSEGDGD